MRFASTPLFGLRLILLGGVMVSTLAYAEAPAPTLRGHATQGGVLFGHFEGKGELSFERHKLRISPEGDFVLGLGPNHPGRAELHWKSAEGEMRVCRFEVEARTYQEEKIDGLPEDQVILDAETRRDLRDSRRDLDKLRKRDSERAFFSEGFRMPVKGRITGVYGSRRILNGKEVQPHWGLDLAAAVGKPVRAPAPGEVVFIGEDVPLAGRVVLVDHGHGLTSAFLHLARVGVKEGQVLKAGQTLGRVGQTGRTTGAHLDWRMNWFDKRVDPELVVAKAGSELPQVKLNCEREEEAKPKGKAPQGKGTKKP